MAEESIIPPVLGFWKGMAIILVVIVLAGVLSWLIL